MDKKALTVTGTGDSLFVTEFPKEYDKGIGSVAALTVNLQVNTCGFISINRKV